MYGRKEKKLRKQIEKKKGYISYFRSRKKKAGGRTPRSTWTAAQWHSSSETGKKAAKAGMSYRKYKRMGGK